MCADWDRPGALAEEPDITRGPKANAYGVLMGCPLLAAGSVTVPVVFHVISDHTLTVAEKGRKDAMPHAGAVSP